jgi:tetratricopeptide (TPR) repeat protein
MDDSVLGTSKQTEIIDNYPMDSWENKLKAPYVERFNGNICVRNGEIDRAMKYYNKSLFGLKMIFDGNKDRFMNNPSEAVEFVRDIEIPVSLNLAHCYNKKEMFHYAIKYCADVLKNDPENVKGLYRRAVAYTGIGEVSRARKDLDDAL